MKPQQDYTYLGSDVTAEVYKERIRELEAQLEALVEQLEADRTKVAECMTAANKAVDERHWLTEGRGPYEWDDDRWHSEFYAAALEIKAAIEPLTKIASNWTGCPMKAEEIAKARIDLKAKVERQAAAIQAGVEALEAYSNPANWTNVESKTGDETIDRIYSHDGNGWEPAEAALAKLREAQGE